MTARALVVDQLRVDAFAARICSSTSVITIREKRDELTCRTEHGEGVESLHGGVEAWCFVEAVDEEIGERSVVGTDLDVQGVGEVFGVGELYVVEVEEQRVRREGDIL